MLNSKTKFFLIGLALLLFLPIGVFGLMKDNITVYYTFDISGAPLQDSMAYSDLQIGSGTGNISGRIGNGRDINSTQYLRTANETTVIAPSVGGYSASTTRGYTIRGWYYYDSIGAGVQDPFGGNNATAGGTRNVGYIRGNNANTYYDVRAGAGGETTVGNGHVSSSWYQYVLVYDAVTSYKTLYKNGTMISNVSVGGVGSNTMQNNSWIGFGSPTLTFDGRVDEILIANRTWSAIEVAWDYNGGSGRSFSEFNITSTATNATVNAYNFYNQSNILSFNVYNNATLIASTTNGTAYLPYLTNTSSLFNLTIESFQHQGYYNETYLNTNVSTNLNASLQPYYITNNIFYARDFYTGTNLTNFSITDQFGNVTSTTNGVINATLYAQYQQFRRYNITYSSTQNGGYFNQSYTNLNTTTTTFTNMSQSIIGFTATQKVTGTVISNANFTTNYTTNTTHYMTAQAFNVTATAPLYNNRTVTYTPTALTSASVNIENLTNQNLSLVVRYALNSSSVPVYTVTISNSTYGYSETFYAGSPSTYVLNLTSGIYYTISVNSTDALSNTTLFYSTAGAYTLNITLVSTTQFNLYFFDEQTLLPVTNVNYTIIGATYAYAGSTSNTSNNANFTGLNTDTYEIRYVDNNQLYNPRSYFITIPITSATEANLSLYMLRTSNATSFVLTVTDTYNQPIAGLTASLLRRYAINGVTTYYVVEMMKPSVALQGATPFSGVANTVPYIFRVQDSAGHVLFQGAGTSSTNLETQYLLSTNVYIKVQTESSVLQGAQNFFGLSTALTNTSTALQLSWSGSSSTLSQICLQMYANVTTQLTNSCSTNPSGVISYTYNPMTGTTYTGVVYARSAIDGKDYLIGNPFVDDRRTTSTSPSWGGLGLFFVIMILMLVGIGFADRPSVSIVIGGVTIFTFFTVNAFGQIISLPAETSFILGSSALLLSFIIAYAMREEF